MFGRLIKVKNKRCGDAAERRMEKHIGVKCVSLACRFGKRKVWYNTPMNLKDKIVAELKHG